MLRLGSERSKITKIVCMEDYFIDRTELAQFVDQLIAKKPLSAASEQEVAAKREALMSGLDRSIRSSIIDQLTDDQLDDFNVLLDHDDEVAEDGYERFFRQAGVDLPQTITNAMVGFARSYLGGANE